MQLQLQHNLSLSAETKTTFKDNPDWGFGDFMSREVALNPTAGFIRNGSMLVGVHISLSTNSTHKVIFRRPSQSCLWQEVLLLTVLYTARS